MAPASFAEQMELFPTPAPSRLPFPACPCPRPWLIPAGLSWSRRRSPGWGQSHSPRAWPCWGGFVAPAKAQGTEGLSHPAGSTWHQSLQENLESSPHSSPTLFFLKSVNEGESLPGCGCHRPAGNVHPGNVIGINCLALFDLWAVGHFCSQHSSGTRRGQ